MSHTPRGRRALAVLALVAAGCGGAGVSDTPPPPPASLALSGAPALDLGDVVVGGSALATLAVTNSGGSPATALSVSTAGPFAVSGGTCGSTLAAGATCAVQISFAPSARGAATGGVTVSFHDGLATRDAARVLSGTGLAPASIALSGASDLGSVFVGAAAGGTATLLNAGDVAATSLSVTAGAPFVFAGGAYPGTGGSCGASLAAGASCTVEVELRPAAGGPASGSLQVGWHDGVAAATASRPLSGTGLLPAALSVGGATDFGPVALGLAGELALTLSNGGDVPATGLGASFTGPFALAGGAWPGSGGDCAASLAAGASCTIRLAFTPASRGAAAGTVTVGFGDGAGASTAQASLSGAGASPAALAWSDAPAASWPDTAVGGSAARVLTLANSGDLAATALSIATGDAARFPFAGGAFPGAGGSCGASLAGGASCTVALAFTPQAPGSVAATLSTGYHDGVAARTAPLGLAGRGAVPASVDVSGTPSLGDVVVGATATVSLTLSNSGEVAAAALAPALSGPFAWAGGTYPGTGGTCAATLGASASCTLSVRFAPGSAGAVVGGVTVGYYDGVATRTAPAFPLSAAGITPASVAISGAPAVDFGAVVVGTRGAATVTLTNSGEAAAASLAATPSGAFAFAGGSFPGAGGSCAATLPAGASCTLALAFAPAGSGAASGSLAVSYHDGAGPRVASRNLSGTGLAPAAVALSGASDLGTALVGGSAEADVTLTNGGEATAASLAAGFTGPFAIAGAWPGAGGTCGASLAPGESCTVRVAFAPAARGAASGSVTVSFQDGVGPEVSARALSGFGLLPAALALSPSPLDLGDAVVGASALALQSVTNTGDVDATGLAAAVAGPFAFAGTGFPGAAGTCGPILGAGASCTLDLAFLPGAPGAAAGGIELSFDSGLEPAAASAALAGTGLAPAALDVAGAADFGSLLVGGRLARTFTVTNSGEVAAAVDLLSISGPFEWNAGTAVASGDCDDLSPLAPGASCAVEVAFVPAVSGAASGGVGVSFSDAAGSRSASLALSGRGLAPAALAMSDGGSFDFGTIATGGSATHVVHVTNQGGWAAALGAATAGAPFGFAGGAYPGTGGSCAGTLEPGFTCRVVLAFAPASAGPASGALAMPYGDGNELAIATLALSGAATDQGFLTITDYPPYYYTSYGLPPDGPAHDYGTVGVGRTASHTFFVTNTGAGEASLVAEGGTSGPFAWAGGAFPGAGGTCPATLAAGMTCTAVVEFTPTGTSPAAGTFSVSYEDGLQTGVATRDLAGAGTELASLAVYDFEPGIRFGDAWDFGASGLGVPAEHEFLLVNGGAGTASAIAGLAPPAGFGWKGGTFPGAGGSCGATLAAGASCRIVAVFQPVAPGTAEGVLGVSYDDGGGAAQTAARAVRGTGVTQAILSIEAEDGVVLDFGVLGVGGSRDRTLRIRNLGGADATGIAARAVAAPFSFADGAYPGTGGTCGETLAPGALCHAVVRFSPAAAGPASAQVALDYSDGAGAAVATRDLVGAGTAGALLAVADWPDGFDRVEQHAIGFGTAAASVTRTLYVRNLGAQPATGLGFSVAGSPLFTVTGGTCPADLDPGVTCSVDVTFTPSGDGPAAASLRLDYGDGAGPAVTTQDLTGASTTRALVSISTCATCTDWWPMEGMDFGLSGARTEQTLYLRNVGAQDAALAPDPVGGSPVFGWASGAFPGVDPVDPARPDEAPPCGATLPAGATCRTRIAFEPPAAEAVHVGLLSIPYSDAAGAAGAVSLPLSGTSTTLPLVSIEDPRGGWGGESGPPPVDFGPSGQDVSRELLVVNRGGGAATLDAASLPAGFVWTSGAYPGAAPTGTWPPPCGATLQAGESCVVSITFQAGTLPGGTHSGTFAVAWGPGGRTASRQLTGVAVDRALLVLADWPGQQPRPGEPPLDFGTSGLPVQRTLYLANLGRQEATLSPAPFVSSPVFDFTGGTFPGGDPGDPQQPGEPPPCGATLPAGDVCRISVTFTPPGTSLAYADVVAIAYGDADGPAGSAERAVRGTATDQPILEILDSPWDWSGFPRPSHDFGVLGQPATHVLVLRNVGGDVAELSDATLPLGFAFPDSAGTYLGAFPGEGMLDASYPPLCSDPAISFSLAPGDACSVLVSFVPAVVVPPGQVRGALVVSYDDGAGGDALTATRELSGTATDRAMVVLSDWPGGSTWQGQPPFDFGAAAQPVYDFFYLRNDGAAAADVAVGPLGTAFAVLDPATAGLPLPMPWEPDDCDPALAAGGTAALPAGAACRLAVAFLAPLPGGPYGTTLIVHFADGLGPDGETRREIGGTSIEGPLLHVMDWDGGGGFGGPPFDFGVAGTAVHHWFYVRNDGRAATSFSWTVGAGFEIVPPAPGEDPPGWPTPPACQDVPSLAPGERCALRVTFRPDTLPSEETVQATLAIGYGTATATRDLRGTATFSPAVFVTEWPEPPFCSDTACMPVELWTPVGGYGSRELWVVNTGGADATDLADDGGLVAPFGWLGGAFPGDPVSPDACQPGQTLAPGARCRVVVELAPTAPGEYLSEVRLGWLAGPGDFRTSSRSVRGVAESPE